MRRARTPWPHNHERWFVSYADFVTLLFALFVVLFAASQTDKHKASAISASIEKALTGRDTLMQIKSPQPAAPVVKSAPAPAKPEPAVDPLAQSLEALKIKLKDEIESGKLRLALEHRGLVISLDTGAFFRLGDDGIMRSSDRTMDKLGQFLSSIPNPLRLEGHTDSLPIQTSRFRSNWELSAARSIAMLRMLQENYGIAANRMAIVGYADTAAIDSNATEEGREKNRRVDIVVLTEIGGAASATAPPSH